MNDPPSSSPVEALSEFELWERSRSGAWAGRGFHYQHWIAVLVLLRQWAGQMPLGYLVPEGLDDCVIELSDRRIWLQARSRKTGSFPAFEVGALLDATAARAEKLRIAPVIRSTVVLEQPPVDHRHADIERLFDDVAGRVFVCQTPDQEVLRLFLTRLEIAPVIAEGLASDLYHLVADTSAQNASLPFDKRRRISATEVDRRIFERLEAEDPTAIDHALLSGVIEPVDFTTPVDELDFYRGVKVKPGHVAANLVLDRPNDVRRVLEALMQRRHVLVSGPSGAGKSALTWLAAAAAAHRMRWYQITSIATSASAEAISRFIRSRRPTAISPLALVLDEVGSANSDLWDALARELRSIPDLYLLGSLRQEDVNLIADQSDTGFISPELDDELAHAVWERLAAANHTGWPHWREPYEQSQGLMLEYVHLLTQGRRLALVIDDQVRQREHEHRDDELRIIRSTAVLCARGGEVDAPRLLELLGLGPEAANRALRRLIDEHLVRESRPGVLGGLHALRSDALVKASHDETVFHASESLWNSLAAATVDTLPKVLRSLLADADIRNDPSPLLRIAGVLANSHELDRWTAVLTGLGLATLDRHVASLMSVLDRHRVDRAHWSLAGSYADPLLDIPELSASDQWTRLKDALSEFRSQPKHDLRAACLAHVPDGTASPNATNIAKANALLSALVPICGSDPIEFVIGDDFLNDQDADIRQIARLLSTAYLVDRELARHLVEMLGGEQALFIRFSREIPWATPPTIDPDGPHGRTVRSDWYQVAEQSQPDPHEAICEICEILIGISPNSAAAASDVVNPSGQTVSIGDYRPWSKNIPRANLPPKPRIAWNVAFRQSLLARSAAHSLTEYTRQMANLVRQTERAFRSFSEKWIRGKRIPNADAVASEINGIIEAVDALAYAAPGTEPPTMTEAYSAGNGDTLGAFLTGVLGNLVRRLSLLDPDRAMATYAGSLNGQACEHRHSAIWRTMSSPPLAQLDKLAERLGNVSSILHEMAHDSNPDAIARIVSPAKKASLGNAVRAAARYSRQHAVRRFETRLRELETELASRGWTVRCLSRHIEELDSPHWPAREIAMLVEVHDLADQWLPILEELLSIAVQHLDIDWPFTVVPLMNGQVLSALATVPTSFIPLPDQDFSQKWAGSLDRPTFSSNLLESFEEALDASLQISAVINARGIQDLHSDEEAVLSDALDRFKTKRMMIESATNHIDTEHFAIALDYLDRNWARLGEELEFLKSGRTVETPLCMAPHLAIAGQAGDDIADFLALRLVLLQTECDRIASA